MKSNKNYQTACSIVIYTFFAIYIVLLLYFLFFSRIGLRNFDLHGTNLVPLYTISTQIAQLSTPFGSNAFANLMVNIALLAPLGLFLPVLLGEKKIKFYFGIIFLLSLFIEIIQFIFNLGSADIDDIILNCIGGLLGLVAYDALRLLLKQESRVRLFIAIISSAVGVAVIVYLAIQLLQWLQCVHKF